MAVTEAAQLVQHSATPDAYANWETEARSLATALTGEVPAGLSCGLDGFGGPAPPPSALAQASTEEMGTQLLGVPVSTKTGWRVATWAVAHAYNYHITSVSFEGRTWTEASGTWSPRGIRIRDSPKHGEGDLSGGRFPAAICGARSSGCNHLFLAQ